MVSFGGKAALPVVANAAATAEYVFGILGNGMAFILSVSAVLPFFTICVNGAVEPEMWVVPQMAALLNTVIWGLLGVPSVQPGNELSMAVNALSFLCMLFCTVTFMVFAGDRCFPFFYGFAFEVTVAAMVWSLVLGLPGKADSKANAVGVCGSFFGTLMNLLPLWNVKLACDHQNVDHISGPRAAGALLNAVIWVIYSCVNGFKRVVFVPNVTAVVVWGSVLVVYFRYTKNNDG